MAKEELEFHDPSGAAWTDLGGGLAERVLSGDPRTGHYTRMLRFDAGTVTAETLAHPFWEEVLILEGTIEDLRLKKTFSAGMYACRPPGMLHGPWSAPQGCTTFEVRYVLERP